MATIWFVDIDKDTDLCDMWQKEAEDIDKHYVKELEEIWMRSILF